MLFGADWDVCAVAFFGAFVGDWKSWRSRGMSRMQRGLEVGRRQMKQIARERKREEGRESRFSCLHLHQFYKANQLIVLITDIFKTIPNFDIFTKST